MKERKEVRQRSSEHWKGGYEAANSKQKQQKQ